MKKLLALLIITGVILPALIFITYIKPNQIQAVTAASGKNENEAHAVTDGTFLQWWLVRDWDDRRWTSEFEILKEAGMKYIILAPTAFNPPEDGDGNEIIRTIFPIEKKGYEMLEDQKGQYPDVVDACLRNAQKMDMKVFIGLNFNDDWWKKSLDAEWVQRRVAEGNVIAGELWKRYKDNYPDAFYGWYWCWEVDNIKFRLYDFANSKKILSDAIKAQLDYLEKMDMRLPLMIAPFMDWRLGLPWGFAKMWEYVFRNSGIKDGDIFCPQDSIGAGGLKMWNFTRWFAELRKAVNTVPGLRFWVIAETFDGTDWTGATIDRLTAQLNELRPYVDNSVTFSYSHYYSPHIVDNGFHKTYMEYMRSGELETMPPTAPSGLRAALRGDFSVLLAWEESQDNMGVCGYYVLRNGKRIANLQVGRKNGNTGMTKAATNFVDGDAAPEKDHLYEVQAYDFAGNISQNNETVVVAIRQPF